MDDLITELELLVDKHGMTHIVNTLAVVCREKAEHLRTWHNKTTAEGKAWEMDSKTLTKAAELIRSDG